MESPENRPEATLWAPKQEMRVAGMYGSNQPSDVTVHRAYTTSSTCFWLISALLYYRQGVNGMLQDSVAVYLQVHAEDGSQHQQQSKHQSKAEKSNSQIPRATSSAR